VCPAISNFCRISLALTVENDRLKTIVRAKGKTRMKFSVSSAVRYSLGSFLVFLAMSAASFGQFAVSVSFAPPALPVYDQPVCPGDGYIWTPGYWAWDDDAEDYYWVPGTWVEAPEVGYLWTPAWWGWGGEAFIFHQGYWGPGVGFYGGISYGFGYFGAGYEGGRWENGRFFYNRSVNNVNVTIVHNVYENRVGNENRGNRVSYNGGNGGINARPSPQQEAVARERHLPPVGAQTQHIQAARGNRELRASANQGRPPIAATARPGAFNDRAAVVPAREAGAPYHPPANRGRTAQPASEAASRSGNNNSRTPNNVHVRDLPPADRPATPNTGNQKLDQKYQKQQQKLSAHQDKERQTLQQRQEQDHQRLAKQGNAQARTQQLEQRHQQQTQQLQQRHTTQQQQMQQRQQPRPSQAKPPKGK
jgi:hypothetical protein